MAVSGDVTVSQNGGQGNAKLHPYLVTLVRWCLSRVWGTATLFLHRLVTAPRPITGSKPLPKPRAASTEHLHPEPRVECVVLHQPDVEPWTVDVIFVHGLYGSLGNTWRQGDWRSKYKLDPTRVPLRDHTTKPCSCDTPDAIYNDINEIYSYETTINENVTFKNINERLKKILPNENTLITEKFYNNTLEILDNYDTQAKFVEELFKNENNKSNGSKCHSNVLNDIKCNANGIKCNNKCVNQCKCLGGCGVGCGCICDDCYSTCWPKDWIKEDFPGARVISINYTSDPYLWRPLWVKESKRLRLHERAEQMIDQLLSMRVGQRPIVWVGHSKGGLFIKQIYCEAYEAHLKMNKHTNKNDIEISINENLTNNKYEIECEKMNNFHLNITNDRKIAKNDVEYNNNEMNDNEFNDNNTISNEDSAMNKDANSNVINDIEACDNNDNVLANDVNNDMINVRNDEQNMSNDMNEMKTSNREMHERNMSSKCKEDTEELESRCSLWKNSAGFMFYSVPHRGSPLADIKTPITARSVELLEIAKDCPLVLELQHRWLTATECSRPQVRSLVETCRTLMSVLWLRIVSVDSADAGVGSLHGVSVDHREICKPSSRDCLLYRELKDLIQNSLKKCDCQ